jgi:electron transfer flavoprotein alpha subunit
MPKNSKGKDIAEIIPARCMGCTLCVGECPVNAVWMENGVAKIDIEKCIGCGKCVDVCPANSILFEKPRKKKPEAGAEAKPAVASEPKPSGPQPHQGVAVFIEIRDGAAADVAWELTGKARELAAKLNVQVIGFLLGSKVDEIAKEAIAYGCDIVYTMDDLMFQVYISRIYGNALTQLCNEVRPEIFLIGATSQGRDVSSVVATQLRAGLTADCTGLDISPEDRLLMMTRPTFGGNIMATIVCRTSRPQMSTVRPKVMKMPKKDPARKGEIRRVKYSGFAEIVPRIIETVPTAVAGAVDIAKAPVLVVLGKGACDSKYFPMLEEFAGALGGIIACSRPVVEAGILPYLRQVGQTGKTVAPKLYIGVGVSGAVQHLVGMQGSEKVVAINVDRHAPMVQIADYAIIGDYLKIVPELLKGLKTRAVNLKSDGVRL